MNYQHKVNVYLILKAEMQTVGDKTLQMYGTAYRSMSLLPLQSTHLKIDWINTWHYKNLNTIGKQNYQEPGLEAELNFEFLSFSSLTILLPRDAL